MTRIWRAILSTGLALFLSSTGTLVSVTQTQAAGCSFFNYKNAYGYTSSVQRGVGGYIYSSSPASLNDPQQNHVVYSYALNPNIGRFQNVDGCDPWLELGRAIGSTSTYQSSSWYLFTYNPNTWVNGNGSDCSTGTTLGAENVYGSAPSNEGYWTYATGYKRQGIYAEGYEFQFRFDFGSLGNHATYGGWSTTTSNYPLANSEVEQLDQTVPCESMNAYWGTDSTGTPNSNNEMVLAFTPADPPTFSQWTDSTTSAGADSGYNWTFLQNYWAAHSYGSPS